VSQFSDKVVVCRDCGKEFAFTAGEQEFYDSRGLNAPTRCNECRAARKAQRESGSGYGGGYGGGGGRSYDSGGYGSAGRSSSDYGGERGGRGGGFGRGGGERGARQMFKVKCAECGVETEVPFEPRSGKPVYCRNCYERRSGRR
jgi:CxxC-x17-CxxC domain-containing protein